MFSYVKIKTINVFILLKLITFINDNLNHFVQTFIFSEIKRMNAVKIKKNNIFLISKWSDFNDSIMLFINIEQINLYEDLICYLNQKNKEFKLWIIFEIITEIVEAFVIENVASSYKYDDSTDKFDFFVKKFFASFLKKEKRKAIFKIKAKFKIESSKTKTIKSNVGKFEDASSQITNVFVRWNILT